MWKLRKYLKHYTKETLIAPLFKFFEACLELVVPVMMAEMIDVGIKNGNAAYCYLIAGYLVGFAVLGLACALVAQYYAAKAAHGYGTELRAAMFAKINSFSHAELDKLGMPALITRITSDINQAEKGVNRFLRLFLRAPFIVAGALVASLIIDWKLGLIFVAVTAIMALFVWLIMALTIPRNKKVQRALEEINGLTRENLTGARVVRAFSRQEKEIADFNKKNERLLKMQSVLGVISSLMNPVTYVFVNLGIVLVLVFGGGFVNAGSLTQGEISALINYMSQILLALVVFANLIVVVASGSASSERVYEVLQMRSALTEGERENSEKPDTVLEFRNVSFGYNAGGDNALENISFTLKRGQTLGIIGGTGSGKSTLIALAERFYDVDGGEVIVDGVPVKEYTFAALRGKFGLVPQKAVLFKNTVRGNVQWGKADATDEEIAAALDVAQMGETLAGWPEGLDKKIEQGGRNLSGGQRQRLTIARAVVGNPEILVLDDSASALDYATDYRLRKAIKERCKSTVIVISQRASAIKNADKILVLDDGKIVGEGTHESLLQTCEVYKEICASQTEGGAK
ncbi:MAG: ATP-binding protein [Bacillota bacterium]|nr:MAG: ATP-binding protein [Bacillota bacterium]